MPRYYFHVRRGQSTVIDQEGMELANEIEAALEAARRGRAIIASDALKGIPTGGGLIIVDLIDKENWSQSGTDIKGDAYEELLSKGASDKGSGAGQYFTPRPLIQAIVDVTRPTVADTIVDPDHRGHGLGLVLKTWNHAFLAESAPGVRWVNTWNARSNTFMIRVNEQLGFEPMETWGEHQLDL